MLKETFDNKSNHNKTNSNYIKLFNNMNGQTFFINQHNILKYLQQKK